MTTSVDARRAARLTGAEKERYVRALFDRIATPYDRLNRRISLGRDERWREMLVAESGAAPGYSVVDLGTGTGELAIRFAEVVGSEGRVTGVDLSANMLAVAEEKVKHARLSGVTFQQGNACETGLPSSCADIVSMGWCLRNCGDTRAALHEALRILKPGGVFVCLDMSRPSFAPVRGLFFLHRHLLMPIQARLAGADREAYRYLACSTDHFPDRRGLEHLLHTAGFNGVASRGLMLGAVALHRAEKPEHPHLAR
jgi:demethylmenaquinone methyltransferase/2-methoxy-6-polyprenyl-1,4-benzoquinol methylase